MVKTNWPRGTGGEFHSIADGSMELQRKSPRRQVNIKRYGNNSSFWSINKDFGKMIIGFSKCAAASRRLLFHFRRLFEVTRFPSVLIASYLWAKVSWTGKESSKAEANLLSRNRRVIWAALALTDLHPCIVALASSSPESSGNMGYKVMKGVGVL